MYLILLYILSFLFIHPLCSGLAKNRSLRLEAFICFMMLFIFFGFRDLPILNDTAHYYAHFQDTLSWAGIQSSIFDIDSYDRFEKGFLVYENILARFFSDPYSIIHVSAFIVTLFFVSISNKYSDNIGYIIFLLFGTIIFTMYSGIRQGLGTCIETLALLYLADNKKSGFVVLTLLAGFVHSSCWFVLPVFFLSYLKTSRRNIILAVVFVAVLFVALDQVWTLIGMGDSIYLETSANRDTFPLAALMNFIVAVAFLLSTIAANKQNNMPCHRLWWWFSILNVSFLFLDINVQIMSRFSTFFYFLSLLFWWQNISHCTVAFKKRQMILIGCLIFLKLWVSFEFRPDWYHLFPYDFYDFGISDHQTDFGY